MVSHIQISTNRNSRQLAQKRFARGIASLAAMFVVIAVSNVFAGEAIVAVHENGRTVFVNNDAPAPAPDTLINNSNARKRLVYWSNVQHRWKRVPMASAAARSARTAAQEVDAAFAAPANASSSAVSQSASSIMAPELNSTATAHTMTQQSIDTAIEAAAKRHNVDANLVRAMIRVESNYNPRAVSRKGAMGLMQLMPSTARQLKVANPFDPNQNIDGGVRHLKLLLDNYGGDVPLSLAAYNAGSGAVARSGGVPPYSETQGYVKKITKLYGATSNSTGAAATIRMSRDPEGHLVFSNE
jgi:soluble lytic murein transglycosylase-like protein